MVFGGIVQKLLGPMAFAFALLEDLTMIGKSTCHVSKLFGRLYVDADKLSCQLLHCAKHSDKCQKLHGTGLLNELNNNIY